MSLEKKTLAVVATTGLLVVLGGESRAENYHVSIGAGTSALPSKSIDSLSSAKSYGRADWEFGMKVPYAPILGDTEIALAWDTGSVSGSSFGRIESDLGLDSVMVIGRVHRPIRSRLSGFGEFGLGVQWGHLELNDAGSGLARRLEDSDKAAATTAGGGLDISLTNPGSAFELVIRAKASYRVVDSHDFRATPMSDDSDELLLTTTSADLGSVNTSGFAWGASIVGRF